MPYIGLDLGAAPALCNVWSTAQLHLTLAHFESPRPEQVPPLFPRLTELATQCGVRWLSPERLETWDLVHDVLIVRQREELMNLQKKVIELLDEQGIRYSNNYDFNPHVTLVKAAPQVPDVIAHNAIIPVRSIELAGLHGITRYLFWIT